MTVSEMRDTGDPPCLFSQCFLNARKYAPVFVVDTPPHPGGCLTCFTLIEQPPPPERGQDLRLLLMGGMGPRPGWAGVTEVTDFKTGGQPRWPGWV